MLSALEVSAVGNLLDAGVYGDMRTVDMEAILKGELTKRLAICDIKALRDALQGAETVVIIALYNVLFNFICRSFSSRFVRSSLPTVGWRRHRLFVSEHSNAKRTAD